MRAGGLHACGKEKDCPQSGLSCHCSLGHDAGNEFLGSREYGECRHRWVITLACLDSRTTDLASSMTADLGLGHGSRYVSDRLAEILPIQLGRADANRLSVSHASHIFPKLCCFSISLLDRCSQAGPAISSPSHDPLLGDSDDGTKPAITFLNEC